MKRSTIKFAVLSAALLASLPAFAATQKYDIDAGHSNVTFGWNHFGFSNPTARLEKIEGSLQLDTADLTKSSVSVTLPLDGLHSGVAKLDEHMSSPDFLDAAKYPTITFKSTKVEKGAGEALKITGDLTVHGVTKSVVLDAKVNKIGIFEIPAMKVKVPAAGFDAQTVIKRSEFGVTSYVPAVSDDITVHITLDAKLAK
jgi:polyisoprenoid-binding protein YceI